MAALNQYAALLDGARPLPDYLGSIPKLVELDDLVAENPSRILTYLAEHAPEGKVLFGLSVYGPGDATRLTYQLNELLEAKDCRTRFIQAAGKPLSAVQVHHNKLLTKGNDWCLFETAQGWRFGRSVWVYDFAGFNERDYKKPAADAKRGMLPPQLARTMVNLASKGTDIAIYDPFCGVGVLLLEALVTGHVAYGSDIDPKAIEDAQGNIEWLMSRRPELPDCELTVHDATKPLPAGERVAIATEGHLGELVRASTDETRTRKEAVAVEDTMRQFLKTAAASLKSGDRLVVTLPAWRIAGGLLRLGLVDAVSSLGYTKIRPVPEDVELPGITDRGTIDVARTKQRVVHELLILERN